MISSVTPRSLQVANNEFKDWLSPSGSIGFGKV